MKTGCTVSVWTRTSMAGWFSLLTAAWTVAAPLPDRGTLALDPLPQAHFEFQGLVGQRVQANVDNWLLRAPQANPGLLEMFRVRDRKPVPSLVPWAGEFVGKYLISGVQALRMTDDPRLRAQLSNVVTAFIATQADDGYLGPFPKDIRLLKNWDLWGHYHAIYALVLWHEHTGDPAALAAARRAADLVCRTYLGTGRRVFDAGDPEMNMAILTGLALLHRLTGEARYLEMVREVERDWERAGDYLRAGLAGREFFQSPRPRWESLHDLQGLFELRRLTCEAKYRDAFVHHWRSIRRWDRRNTGGFSSGEQATGNPYAPTAIETCCTVAWMALTVDYLRLTGDPRAADELELSTFNGGLGAQHPSGRWWTYSTPMDGAREASAHTIVFQSRAGTPELNCCSVNAPRVLGMLGEWSVMKSPDGLTVNGYTPGSVTLPTGAGDVRLTLDRDYPRVSSQRVAVQTGGGEWTLRLRIPAWSTNTGVKANFAGVTATATAGSYLEIRRRWQPGDEVVLEFDFGLRAVVGAHEAASKVSLYRGPVLLAYDQAHNAFDEDALPAVALARLVEARTATADTNSVWCAVDVPTADGRPLRLVDFASAGASGTRYRSWLPAVNPPPPPAFTQLPRDGERIGPGPVQLRWRVSRPAREVRSRVEFAETPDFRRLLFVTNGVADGRLTLAAGQLPGSDAGRRVWWRVLTVNAHGVTAPDVPPASFLLDPGAPAQALPPEPKLGPNGEIAVHSLRGDDGPAFGALSAATFSAREPAGTTVNGRDQMLVYAVPVWPEEEFTVAVRVRVNELPKGRIAQVFSAWAAGGDDPLRLVVADGRLFARIEGGGNFSTPGQPLKPGRWYLVAAVKRAGRLTLFVDGREVGSCAAPELSHTQARDCALGGNPHYGGNEFLAATFSDFALFGRALSAEELQARAPQVNTP